MTSRRFTVLTFAAFALAALLMPATEANAQSVWDVLRDRGRDQRNDDYGRRGGRISDSERRQLRDAARRIDDRAKDFERDLQRAIDRDRYSSRRDSHLVSQARQFRDAARRFRSVAGDSNDLHRSQNEARRLLDEAVQIERGLRNARLDSRVTNQWSQLSNDLRMVSDIYGFRYRDFGNNRDRDWRY